MGKALCEASPAARAHFESADRALGFALGKLCFEGPLEELTLTKNAQPAILTAMRDRTCCSSVSRLRKS